MKWDVFISHASEDKDSVARPLAEELRRAGLKVWYDRFELKIGDSLRESIDEGLRESRWGVVILSPSFFLRPWPRNELNGLAQREVDGRKVILPVWHEVTDQEVRQQSPILADRIAAHSSEGIASVAAEIVERVKGSPQQDAPSEIAVSRPQLRGESESSILLMTESGYLLVESRRIELGESLELEIVPGNSQESAFLTNLRAGSGRGTVGAAFKLQAVSGHLTSASQIVEGDQEIWNLSFTPDESRNQGTFMEMSSVNGVTSDEIAAMRARLILLNEKVSDHQGGDGLLQSFVEGMNTPLRVSESPFPNIYEELGTDTESFLQVARLTAVLWLIQSLTVETIERLELDLITDELRVDFKGRRRKQYVNADPASIEISGTCPLKSQPG